jgi:GMP synthase (glutamine-hydrolysing)
VYVFGPPLAGVRSINTITSTRLTPPVILQLQEADDIVNQILLKYDLIQSLSQVPVILFPVEFDAKNNNEEGSRDSNGKRSICIRTFITNDFMTGVPAHPGKTFPLEALAEIVNRIIGEVKGISRVCFDLTSKPPATTEWE